MYQSSFPFGTLPSRPPASLSRRARRRRKEGEQIAPNMEEDREEVEKKTSKRERRMGLWFRWVGGWLRVTNRRREWLYTCAHAFPSPPPLPTKVSSSSTSFSSLPIPPKLSSQLEAVLACMALAHTHTLQYFHLRWQKTEKNRAITYGENRSRVDDARRAIAISISHSL